MVTKRIRDLPFADGTRDILATAPDFEFLTSGGALDPLRDFDHVLLGSLDIKARSRNFLVFDYGLTRAELQSKIDEAAAARREEVEWTEHGAELRGSPKPSDGRQDRDPRVFVLPDKPVAMYLHPDQLRADPSGPSVSSIDAEFTKLARDFRRNRRAGVKYVVSDAAASLPPLKGVPFTIPAELVVTVEAKSSPKVGVELVFASADEAREFGRWFESEWPAIIERNLSLKIVVEPMLAALTRTRRAERVRFQGRFDEAQIRLLMTILGKTAAKSRAGPEPKPKAAKPGSHITAPPSFGRVGH